MPYLIGFAVMSAIVLTWAFWSFVQDLDYSPLGRPDVAD